MGCDHTNKDSQEEKLGGGKSLVMQAAIDEMLRRGAAYYADIITVGKPRRWRGFTDSTEQLQNNSSAYRSVRSS